MSRLLGVLGVGEVDVRDQVWGVGGTPVTSSRLQSTAVPEYRHYRFNREAVCQKKMLFKNLKKCSSFMEFMSTPPPLIFGKNSITLLHKKCVAKLWIGSDPPPYGRFP